VSSLLLRQAGGYAEPGGISRATTHSAALPGPGRLRIPGARGLGARWPLMCQSREASCGSDCHSRKGSSGAPAPSHFPSTHETASTRHYCFLSILPGLPAISKSALKCTTSFKGLWQNVSDMLFPSFNDGVPFCHLILNLS
jgi:hypothetical protein